MADNTHPAIADALKAIADIPTQFTADEAIPGSAEVRERVESHVQGIARLGDIRYLTHNDKKGSTGLLILVRNQKILDQIHLTERILDGHALNHAGGLQRIGRYLIIPLDATSDGKNVSRVTFWDLADPVAPKEIEGIAIECHTQKADAAGIANTGTGSDQRWYVATCDEELVSVYKSTDFPDQSFAFEFDCKVPYSYESLCLLSDTSGTLYAVGFRSEIKVVLRDVLDVFVVDPAGRALRPAGQRHLSTNGMIGEDVHFRWGAGLEIEADGRLTVMGTKRNFDSIFLADLDRDRLAHPEVERAVIDRRFHINLFEH